MRYVQVANLCISHLFWGDLSVGRFELLKAFEKFCPAIKWSLEDSEPADIAMREEYSDYLLRMSLSSNICTESESLSYEHC